MPTHLQVSLVATVLNEAEGITDLLASIDEQSRQPDEIVLVDGGSHDGTVAILERWAADRPGIRVLSAPGSTISGGRNLGIRVARHELIAVADAGVTLDSTWLERLTACFEEDPRTSVAGGFFVPEGRSIFERTYPILLAYHKQTDPHRAHEAAQQATLARMERENFTFPEFATWILKREEGSDSASS